MTSVVIVEDSAQLADAVGRQLEAWHGYSVTWVKDPYALDAALQWHRFDLALVDLLFEHLNQEFDTRRQAGKVKLSSPALLITGLTAIRTLQEKSPTTRTVIWTSGEANRRLHILYAYEELGQRAFCSKNSGGERADALADALAAAMNGAQHIDPSLNLYLPAPGAVRIHSAILQDELHRAIWRAVALGAHTRASIAEIIGYSTRYIGNHIPTMYANLRTLDPGLPESHQPLAEIIRYAALNWHFLLDDAVRRAYP